MVPVPFTTMPLLNVVVAAPLRSSITPSNKTVFVNTAPVVVAFSVVVARHAESNTFRLVTVPVELCSRPPVLVRLTVVPPAVPVSSRMPPDTSAVVNDSAVVNVPESSRMLVKLDAVDNTDNTASSAPRICTVVSPADATSTAPLPPVILRVVNWLLVPNVTFGLAAVPGAMSLMIAVV